MASIDPKREEELQLLRQIAKNTSSMARIAEVIAVVAAILVLRYMWIVLMDK